MKHLIFIFAIIAWPELSSCQIPAEDATVTIKVIGDDHKPIDGAKVGAGFALPYWVNQPYRATTKEGITSSDGIVTLKEKTSGRVTFGVTKDGYYQTIGRAIDFVSQIQKKESLEAEVTAILKKKVNPISMYAKKVNTLLPKPNQKYGYDLIIGDWVAPLGKGSTSDLIFEVTGYYNSSKDYDSTLHVTFSNKGDGLLPFDAKPYVGSILLSGHEAPESGYKAERTWRKICKPEQMSKDWINDSREDQNYYFRVRTVLGDKGQILRANYGKIYGDITFGGASSAGSYLKIGSYYLNPTPNDRNMEFDPNKNLFTNLTADESVTAP